MAGQDPRPGPQTPMDADSLRSSFQTFLPAWRILQHCSMVELVKRVRKLDVVALVVSLVLTAGSDDSGRQADAYSQYLEESDKHVVRGAFYAWFTEKLALMMATLAREAMERVWALPPVLTGDLVGVEDWLLVDSETVTLPDELAEDFPATSTPAGLKVPKWFSLGRNNIVDIELSPAREHDAPHLVVGERLRGMGLIVDLGYASRQLIADCKEHGVSLILRLEKGWRPWLLREVCADGTVFEVEGQEVTDALLDLRTDETDGATFDLDVAFGQGKGRVEARLVGVPGNNNGYHWCITLLPRETHSPQLVCRLYRARWEIECDNKRDRAGARLDQIRGRKRESVIALVYASLLRTILANHLVYIDLRDRPPKRAPLHGQAMALALSANNQLLLLAIEMDEPAIWNRAARVLRARAHDPNCRRRPSILDQLLGLTAPPGRPRRARQRDCPPEAHAFRRANSSMSKARCRALTDSHSPFATSFLLDKPSNPDTPSGEGGRCSPHSPKSTTCML